MAAPRLTVHAPMDLEAIPEYPLDPDLRLDSHSFIQWEHRRWMSSDMRWNGTHECKSMWFELVNLAHGETPVGTLPHDVKRLARMVQPAVDLTHFEALCQLEFGPLHGWIPCRCGEGVGTWRAACCGVWHCLQRCHPASSPALAPWPPGPRAPRPCAGF
ncbi:hypothetical protein [Pseudooceanicola marinus]|uniref:hypothetical protein n=1 Tax=Pseudooceanicola marinus TaxID=396013 RepID=UPI001E542C98|nr:hypothetical protein [Pseudooceanicola marinus]